MLYIYLNSSISYLSAHNLKALMFYIARPVASATSNLVAMQEIDESIMETRL